MMLSCLQVCPASCAHVVQDMQRYFQEEALQNVNLAVAEIGARLTKPEQTFQQ